MCQALCSVQGTQGTRSTWPRASHSLVGEAVNNQSMESQLVTHCEKVTRDIHGARQALRATGSVVQEATSGHSGRALKESPSELDLGP